MEFGGAPRSDGPVTPRFSFESKNGREWDKLEIRYFRIFRGRNSCYDPYRFPFGFLFGNPTTFRNHLPTFGD